MRVGVAIVGTEIPMLGTGYLSAMAAAHAKGIAVEPEPDRLSVYGGWRCVIVVGCASSKVQVEGDRHYIFEKLC